MDIFWGNKATMILPIYIPLIMEIVPHLEEDYATQPIIFFVMLCFAGAILSVGGFLSFMVTGSIPAIRFGVILGGALLAFSISSLRSWRKGESSSLALKGQSGMFLIVKLFGKECFSFCGYH